MVLDAVSSVVGGAAMSVVGRVDGGSSGAKPGRTGSCGVMARDCK